jgi:tight adherence protein C
VLDILVNSINTQSLTMLFAAIAAAATVLTLAMPFVFTDPLDKRMRSVVLEREKMRQRERMAQAKQKVSLRQSPKQYVQTIVDHFNLNRWLGQEEARLRLVQAGYRGQAPYVTFLFLRLLTPAICLIAALFYMFVVLKLDQPLPVKIGIAIAAAYAGMHLPLMLLKNQIQRRQLSISLTPSTCC